MVEPEIPNHTGVVLGFPKQVSYLVRCSLWVKRKISVPSVANHAEAEVDKDVVCLFLKAYPIANGLSKISL